MNTKSIPAPNDRSFIQHKTHENVLMPTSDRD